MTQTKIKIKPEKPAAFRLFESLLLAVCLCVISLRLMYTESPYSPTININQALSNEAFSLIISTILLLAVVVWFVLAICSGKVSYRFSGIEAGLVLFLIAGILGIVIAPNKRAAIIGLVTLLSPMLMALLLVQILDSPSKIRLLLLIVVALGAVSFYQCLDQSLSSNQDMIHDYERDPAEQIAIMGINEGSFEHFLYEHRLYSKDIRGFLTTSNSTGSFMIMAVFASISLLLEKLKGHKKSSQFVPLLCCTVMTVVVIAGLVITQSKGAIGAVFLSAVIFAGYLVFGDWLRRYRKAILILTFIIMAAGVTLAFRYGITHGRLPGGNSMLVRWQYWHGAANVYADKPYTGIGPGNFSTYYTHFKHPAALETVHDPHNFILSLLCQYGPVGLFGFLAAFLFPLYKTVFAPRHGIFPEQHNSNKSFKSLAMTCLFFILTTLLLARPVLMADNLGGQAAVIFLVILILYIVPVCVFVIAFWLMWISHKGPSENEKSLTRITQAAIFSSIVGVVIANLIDFAIFEPGVNTLFWALIASLVAVDIQRRDYQIITFACNPIKRIAIIAVGLIIICVYFKFALIPAVKAGAKIQQAMHHPNSTHDLLDRAAEDDMLDPAPLNMNGRAYLQHYDQTGKQQTILLEKAKNSFLGAICRDEADFKNYAKLTTVYNLLAETSPVNNSEWIQKAYDAAMAAVKRYPGSGKLRIELGKLAEKLSKPKEAVEQYRKAVEIEDSFRQQFRIMYPKREMFSRLSEERYQFAKERISQLGM